MKVSDLIKEEKVTISCELFPPKQGTQLDNYKAIVAKTAELKPAYISCTYGATGGTSDYTVEIADAISFHGIPAIAHLTCASSTKEKVCSVIEQLNMAEDLFYLKEKTHPKLSELFLCPEIWFRQSF